jgi:hypothetical protein
MMSDARAVIVHPAFALEWRDVSDFRGEFGPYNGRYVPRYPTTWTAECLKHLKELDLKPMDRARLLESVRRDLLHCTAPGEGLWDASATWEANVSRISKECPDALIVGNGLDPEPFSAWPESVSDVRDSRCRSWAYRGTVREYLQACKPLMVNAPAAYLIDPYLDPLAPSVEDLLRSMFEAIKGSRCYQIHLITRHQTCGGKKNEANHSSWMPLAKIESELNRLYASQVGKERSLIVHLVDKPRREEAELRLHDRFFLTNFGAISFGRGFVLEYQEHPQETAHIVDRSVHEKLKTEFIDGVARYRERLPLLSGIPRPSRVTTLIVSGVR